MKLGLCRVLNFGSYKSLSFDFANQGLTLVSGKTGSGKSTLLDLACWILLGTTAKNGSVDDVRNWEAKDELTCGYLMLTTTSGEEITVTRARGASVSQNDLYWTTQADPDTKYRGKDITDTQKQLNSLLGFDSDFFSAAAYYHEFSMTREFFTASAKDRRNILKNIASLDFPNSLAQKLTDRKKQAKAKLIELTQTVDKEAGYLRKAEVDLENTLEASAKWVTARNRELKELKTKSENFEANKEAEISSIKTKQESHKLSLQTRLDKLEAIVEKLTASAQAPAAFLIAKDTLIDCRKTLLNSRCPTCGGPTKSEEAEALLEKIRQVDVKKQANDVLLNKLENALSEINLIQGQEDPYEGALLKTQAQENNYEEQIKSLERQENPFKAQEAFFRKDLEDCRSLLSIAKSKLAIARREHQSLTQLFEYMPELRAALVRRSVKAAEVKINGLLDKYFESEFIVKFEITDADSIDVAIEKSGNSCSYTQLSKGQRCLLNLCFSVSVMELAANNKGIHFNTLCFDEALDGLDVSLKLKAFSLFEELSTRHDTVIVVDHSQEFQSLFNNTYEAVLTGDISELVKYEE